MLKKEVTYENFDGETETDTLYFNLTRTELMDHMGLEEKLTDMQKRFGTEERELTISEKQEILDLIKFLIKISYGIRTDKRFEKSEQIWTEFTQTAAYDEFLFSLFKENEAISFLIAVMPSSLQGELKKEVTTLQAVPDVPVAPAPEKKEYTQKELLEMPQEEFEEIVGTDPKGMSKEHLMIAMQRKNAPK